MKKILLAICILTVAIVFVLPLLLPKTFNSKVSLEIQVPVEVVFDRVANLHSWKDWSPWYAQEPSAEFKASGTPGIVGSQLERKGQKIGQGRQILRTVENYQSLRFQLDFIEPPSSPAEGYWQFEDTGDGSTIVTWGIEGSLSYPLERLFGLVLPGMLKKDFSQGLSSLKTLMEKE